MGPHKLYKPNLISHDPAWEPRYLDRVQNLTNFHPVGRLAEYRYYDMDAVTASALELSDEIIACHA